MRCSIWRDAAENVTESLTKGTRVIVQGRLVQMLEAISLTVAHDAQERKQRPYTILPHFSAA